METSGFGAWANLANSTRPRFGKAEFQSYDYVLFVGTLLISLGIGIFYGVMGRDRNSTAGYLMGNRNLGTIPVAISMFMSYISAILVLGNTAEMYGRGVHQWLAALGTTAAYGVSCLIFVPLFFPLKLTSSFEYFEVRFKSKAVKLTGTILLMISQLLYMGIAIYSPATALDAVTPIPTYASIIATGIVGAIYTTIGGMKAVIWTDVFQAGVYTGGLIAVLALGTPQVGGISEVWNQAGKYGRLDVNFSVDPTIRMTFWSVVIGRFLSSLQVTGTSQTSVQRYCALPNLRRARISVLLNIPFLTLMYSLTCLVGLTVFAYFSKIECDVTLAYNPATNRTIIGNANQLLPFFINNVIRRPALPGLFVAVLFSGALSTISSSLNSLAAVTWKDLMEWRFSHLPEERKALITKGLVAGYGALAVIIAFAAEIMGGNVLQASQSFVSGVAGPLFGMFVLGSCFPCSNWIGALTGAWVGLAFTMTCTVGNYVIKPFRATLPMPTENCTNYGLSVRDAAKDPENVPGLWQMSHMYFATIGSLTCVIVGLIVSFITGPTHPTKADPHHFIPFFQRLVCCLPQPLRKYLWCGVDVDSVEYDENGIFINHNNTLEPIKAATEEVDNVEMATYDNKALTKEEEAAAAASSSAVTSPAVPDAKELTKKEEIAAAASSSAVTSSAVPDTKGLTKEKEAAATAAATTSNVTSSGTVTSAPSQQTVTEVQQQAHSSGNSGNNSSSNATVDNVNKEKIQ